MKQILRNTLILLFIMLLGIASWGCSPFVSRPVPQDDQSILSGLDEALLYDRIPAIMADGVLYLDTGLVDYTEGRCGTMDGNVTSQCDPSKLPTKDGQSNFGKNFGYQRVGEGVIEIRLDHQWLVFATEEVKAAGCPIGEIPRDAGPQ